MTGCLNQVVEITTTTGRGLGPGRAVVIIPASDVNAHEVELILQRTARFVSRFIVVHNSSAAPSEVVAALVSDYPRIPFAVGKSDALALGLEVALELPDVDFVVQIDGHLKQDPRQVEALLAPLHAGDADLVVLNRYERQDLSRQEHREAVRRAMSVLAGAVTGQTLPDTVCGTRAYSLDLARRFTRPRYSGYGVEMEQLAIAALAGARIESVAAESNRQADATVAEKLEDNLEVLRGYARANDLPSRQFHLLAHYLQQVKERRTFDSDLRQFDGETVVRWTYAGRASGLDDAYQLSSVTFPS